VGAAEVERKREIEDGRRSQSERMRVCVCRCSRYLGRADIYPSIYLFIYIYIHIYISYYVYPSRRYPSLSTTSASAVKSSTLILRERAFVGALDIRVVRPARAYPPVHRQYIAYVSIKDTCVFQTCVFQRHMLSFKHASKDTGHRV
jgi:hypothetical protein